MALTKEQQVELARRKHVEALRAFCAEIDAENGPGHVKDATMAWFKGTLRSLAVGVVAFDLGDEAWAQLCGEAWVGANEGIEDLRRSGRLGAEEQEHQEKRDAPDEHKSIGAVPMPLRAFVSKGAERFISALDAEQVGDGGPAYVVAELIVAVTESRLIADTFGVSFAAVDAVVALALERMRSRKLPPAAETGIVEAVTEAAEVLVFKPGREMAT